MTLALLDRSTCLYCEIDGVSTPLIPSSRGGFCPEHGDPALLEVILAPTPDPDPLLLTRGKSTRNGRKAA